MTIAEQKLFSLKNDLIRHIQSGQYKKAEKLYLRCKGHEINDVELWRLFAGVLSERGNFAEIVYCCSKILKIQPDDYQVAYNLGAALQNLGKFNEAIQQYESCIAAKPDSANAYINCAHLYYLTGNPDKSVLYYQNTHVKIDNPEMRMQYSQALMASGDSGGALQQLSYILTKEPQNRKAMFLTAQCYYETGNYADSEKYYSKLLELDRNNVNAINNLGRLYEETGNLNKAVETYREAIEIDDSIAILHQNLGKSLVKIGDLNGAEKAFLRSLEINADHPESWFNLGKIYSEIQNIDSAKECFTKALSMNIPEHMKKADEFILAAKYFLSSVDKPDSFNEDKKAFVSDLFDGYADKFDDHLVDRLYYRTPEIINQMLSVYIKRNNNNAIDLGCGTGLCCKYLRKFSKHLTGIDLSSRMIEKARKLDCYDQLIVGEITEIVNESTKHFDLIVAADVFVYIGSLSPIFDACSIKINNSGFLIFSTEYISDDESDDFRLFDSGRHKHTQRYLNSLAIKHGFDVIEHHSCVLRKENDKEVEGTVSVLKKKKIADNSHVR